MWLVVVGFGWSVGVDGGWVIDQLAQAAPPPPATPRPPHLDVHVIVPPPEHPDRREPGDEVRPAQLHLRGAVHLGEADAAVRALGVLGVDVLGGGLPGGLQALAPVAPGGSGGGGGGGGGGAWGF